MKTISQMTTLGSLCLLLAGTATAAFAQDNSDHRDNHDDQGGYSQQQYGQHQYDQNRQYGDSQYRRSDQYRHAGASERRRLDRLHVAYVRAATHGHYAAAERDHQHAQAIRAHIRDQHSDQYRNGGRGQYQGRSQHQGDHQGDHQDQHGNN